MVQNLPANAGDITDVGSGPGSGRSPEEGTETCSSVLAWRILMDRGAWWATVHRVAKTQTRLKQLSCTHGTVKEKTVTLPTNQNLLV